MRNIAQGMRKFRGPTVSSPVQFRITFKRLPLIVNRASIHGRNTAIKFANIGPQIRFSNKLYLIMIDKMGIPGTNTSGGKSCANTRVIIHWFG
mmetsp:Transcript_26381/g.63630  ORF Transcript_26381/g.63630 Transcript_26381/m.63630 type:complete len:93 (+) Transcript_26381:699-977(+)